MSADRVLIQVTGLQRSGNHAIISWICSLFRAPAHFNDRAHDSLARPERIAAINAMTGNDCIVYSFEDSTAHLPPGARLLDSVVRADPAAFPGLRLVELGILRDPYNCWASRLKAQEGRGLTSSPHLADFVADWQAMADLCAARPEAFVSYNRWFASEAYRRAICARLGGTYAEHTLDEVPKAGGGSSFDGYARPSYGAILANPRAYLTPRFLRRLRRDPRGYLRRLLARTPPQGRALPVEERWRYLIGQPGAMALFTDDRLRRSSEALFGFSVDPEGRIRRPAPAEAARPLQDA